MAKWNRTPWGSGYDYRERMLTCTCRARSCGVCLIAIRMLVNLKSDRTGTAAVRRMHDPRPKKFWL
jgi:hypothetical protein